MRFVGVNSDKIVLHVNEVELCFTFAVKFVFLHVVL